MAALLSTVYGLVMVAVLVGVCVEMAEDGPLSPSSLFLYAITASFVVTGILHPQEVYVLPFGLFYYISVPSMYLLLIVYALFNLNDVTWGTREVKKARSKKVSAGCWWRCTEYRHACRCMLESSLV